MAIDVIEHEFRKKICDTIRLMPEGLDCYRVLTPFLFDDGDHFSIILRREAKDWLLSDEGNTFMHLTYDIDENDLRKGTRNKIIENTIDQFSVHNNDGELRIIIPDAKYGDALYSFIQAIGRISDVSFLSRERVRSTFLDDFQQFLENSVSEERREFEWHDPVNDPEGKYTVDCRVNHLSNPLHIFALPNDDRVRDATIVLLQLEKWGSRAVRSIGIFENQEDINRKVLARFSDICEKQFSSLSSNQTRISNYLEEALSGQD